MSPGALWKGLDVSQGRLIQELDNKSEERSNASASGSLLALPHKNKKYSGPLRIALLLGSGSTLIFLHHFFYAYLNKKSVTLAAAELPPFLRDQNTVSFIGTTISHVVRILLSMAVGVAFAQHFWATLRSQSLRIGQIDVLVRCGQSILHPSAIHAASTSFSLFMISLVASALALVVVLTPGSLSIDSNFLRTQSCLVPTVPNIVQPDFEDIGDRLEDSTMAIYASSSYFPPLLTNQSAACGEGASSCTYNVSLVGASFDCVDVTNSTDLHPLLHPQDPPTDSPYLIWDFGKPNFGATFTFLSQDLVKGAAQATNCTVFNASYDVEVKLEGGVPSVHIWNVVPESILVYGSFLGSYAHAALDWLEGTVYAGPGGNFDASQMGDIRVQDNTFFVITQEGNHTWGSTIVDFLASYMHNVSVSLLSGNIYYGVSNDSTTNLIYVNSTCSSTFAVYNYDSFRLLSVYITALFVSTAIGIFGSRLALRNGRKEKLLFSHVIRIGLNDTLFRASGRLEADTLVRLSHALGDETGSLLPDGGDEDSKTETQNTTSRFQGLRSDQVTSKLSNLRTLFVSGEWKMVLLIAAALCCMVMHHFYNRFLEGKVPTSSVGVPSLSHWATDQSVVSDVGIALGYAGQTLLATTIAICTTQIFWRSLRSRAITIAVIDALEVVQDNPFSLSSLKAFRGSPYVLLLSFLVSSMTLVSIFSTSSVKVSPSFRHSEECAVMVPQNLTDVVFTSDVPDYTAQLNTALTLGTYLSPLNPCDLEDGVKCSYNVDFIGPGFDCQDVTEASNATQFITSGSARRFEVVNQFGAFIAPQTEPDFLQMQVSVQTWDIPRSIYQAANCTGVLRSYSISVSHNSTSIINVTETQVISLVYANMTTAPYTFAETYLSQIMSLLAGLSVSTDYGEADRQDGSGRYGKTFMEGSLGTLGNLQLDGNITFRDNMTVALEELAQNASMSLLSGKIIIPGTTRLLEGVNKTCTYSFTAYTYSPHRLFLTYGIAIFVTALCAAWGAYTIRQTGVEESMDFSRILRAVLNEKLYRVKEKLEMDTRLKANESVRGEMVPALS